MKIAIGCDHGGINLKPILIKYLEQKEIEYIDFGTYTTESTDYNDYAVKVCDSVVKGECDLGILICGTGIGMSIAANKIKGIRAAAVSEVFSATMTRKHNDANVLCFGARVIGIETAKMLVDAFIETEYEGQRHQRRVDMITKLEEN
jgi:ribose 5-phosphate isomerase B